ncbi:cytochrome P450, family 706, subfamily A, polypeptide 6 [Hibiscus trionum]|nr:cytochrome P450, family 706, subfamily A, polypeptide 6 [Hibiscus trionum]
MKLLLLLFKKLRSAKVKLPPGPYGVPLVGYLPFLGRNIHQTFMELANIYGPIYKLSIGQKLFVLISSPALAKEVVRDQDITFANRNPTIAALAFSFGGKDIAFTPYGPEWCMLRRIFVQEMQSNANLDVFYPLRRDEVKKSVIDVYRSSGTPIDVGLLAFTSVINMITSMFWGGTLEADKGASINAQFRDAVSELLVIWGKPNISDFIPLLARFDIQGVERDMKRSSRWIEQIFDFVIDQRIQTNSLLNGQGAKKNDTNKDFLGFLLEFKDHDTGKSLSRAQMKAFLADIVIGGTGTTSTAFVWTMAELMLHPKVMKKAQDELLEVVGAGNIVEEYHSHKLLYLQAVVKETLRLHPPAPVLLPRCPIQTCTVGGYTIPKGAKVFLNAWAIQRDSQLWENPSKFEPERFLGDAKNLDFSGNEFHYIPFGSGRRICAGLRLGERMLMYTLSTFLHMFHWNVPDDQMPDTEEKFGIVLEKSTPLIAIPMPRLNNLKLYE